MAKVRLTGYCDRFGVKPGERLQFMVSAEGAGQAADVQIVRLIHGDENPQGPGFIEQEVEAPVNGRHATTKQYTQMGSFVTVDDHQAHLALGGSFTLWAFIWPTTPRLRRQGLLTRWSIADDRGYALGINERGELEFWVGDGAKVDAVHAEIALSPRQWYLVAASYDASHRRATLYQEPIESRYGNHWSRIVPLDMRSHVAEQLRIEPADAGLGFLWAGAHDRNDARGNFVAQIYNGKIDRCGVYARALERAEIDALKSGAEPDREDLVAHWDTTAGYTDEGIGDVVVDVGPHRLNGVGVNRPIRAMTGYNWNGRDDCFRLAPEQYGGIHFHDDAIVDCRWTPTFEMTVPDLKSGVYAARVRASDAEDHIPFFVRPTSPQAGVALLVPTCSYLAYANDRLGLDFPTSQVVSGHVMIFHDWDIELSKHPEYGASTYDHHSDDEGVCYSGRLRPIFNMRPRHRMAGTTVAWQFPADLSVVYWLETQGYDYDVITDEDLHREGLSCLEPYKAVINATHAEYYSERMMDATEDYLAGGGRLMYLSGNGYYWVVSFREGDLTCMEVRKLDSGSRAWQANAGEHYMASNGERSGLWRNRGRPPQKLVGTGFTSEGMDESKPYRRMPDSYHRSVAWIFEGIEEELIGDFGLAQGGAAGIEIDRYDLSLGTPPHTRILASSEGHSDSYPHVSEEIAFSFPGLGGTQDYQIRADMTYFTTPNNGAVWSASSIAWGQALPCNGGDNNVSRVMRNVLDAFMREGPLPGSVYHAEEKLWR
ncbi:MAG: N,N-dimethylformamidase beta subunit family domain-containing protein [Gammaproteobacteria bacterium]